MLFNTATPNQVKTKESYVGDEVNNALRPWVMYGIPATMLICLITMIGVSVLLAYFPTSPFFGAPLVPHNPYLNHGILYYVSCLVFIPPMYLIFHKVKEIRLEHGRRYVAEKRWGEADAALGALDDFTQRFFDQTGEAHYLWAFALDGLGKRTQAEKAREFVRKHRTKGEWAAKLGPSKETVVLTASEIRKRSTSVPTGDQTDGSATGSLKKSKRRRF